MPAAAASAADQESVNRQAAMLKALAALPTEEVLGVACSVLLHCALNQPAMLRRVLHEPVVRDGFRGSTLWNELARAARG